MGILKGQDMSNKQKHAVRANVVSIEDSYVGRGDAFLLKEKGAEKISILRELLEMREKLNLLINRVKQEVGLGSKEGSLARDTNATKRRSPMGYKCNKGLRVEQRKEKPNGPKEQGRQDGSIPT